MPVSSVERPVSALRQRMLEDMAMRGLRSDTQHDYVRVVRGFADGIGMSAEQRKGSLGLRLINMAARQIMGVATIEARARGTGTVVTIDFPDPDNSGK